MAHEYAILIENYSQLDQLEKQELSMLCRRNKKATTTYIPLRNRENHENRRYHYGCFNYMSVDNHRNIGWATKSFAEHRAQNPGYVVNKLGWAVLRIRQACSEFAEFLSVL